MLDPWRQVTQTASRQLSLVSERDLDRLSVPASLRRTWARQGRLVSERRHVHRIAGTAQTWTTELLAAVMGAGPPAVASHLSAAVIHGLSATIREATGPRQTPARPFHLTCDRRIRMSDVVCHYRSLPAAEVTVINAVPTTTVERTLFDLAGLLALPALGACVDEALRHGARLATLRGIIERHPRTRWRWPMQRVLADRSSGYQPGANPWERGWDDWWDRSGLPTAQRQHPVVVNGRHYVLDRAIPDLMIGVEWNGFDYHGRRTNFDRDSHRRADLVAAGWEVIEVTSTWTPERVVEVVTAVVARRRQERRAP